MQDKTKKLLRVEPPKPVQVNRVLVLFMAGIVVFFVIWAIVNAFSEPKKQQQNSALTSVKDKPYDLSANLKDLPNGYADVNAIRKYSAGLQDNELTVLQKELDSLKAEHVILEQELLAAKGTPTVATHAQDEQALQQAKNSSLVFGGVSSNNTDTLVGGSPAGGPPAPGQPNASNPLASGVAPTQQQADFFAKQHDDEQKVAVMKAADNPDEIYDLHNMVTPVSPYEIQAGTVIPAVLITGINTTLEGTVVAQVRQSLFDTITGKYLLVPKGSKLLGDYTSRVSYGQQRVLITFNRIIRPDGSSILLGKPNSADLQGQSGMEGDVDNHWMRILGAATISTILSVGAGVASDNVNNSNANYNNSKQNAILGGAQGVSQAGQALTTRAMDIQPTITLPAGYQFNVIVKKDMVLTPYSTNN